MATSTTSAHAETITPAMRDRQARGKDPYSLDDLSSDAHGDEDFILEQGQRVRKHHETWEQKERTNFATRVLSNPDLLLWHAQAQGDSITSQRLRFTAMLCGYEDHYDSQPQGMRQQGNGSGSGAAAGPSSGPGARR